MERERVPGWLQLVELWLKTYFTDRVGVVFMCPSENLEVLRPWFSHVELTCAVNAEFMVYVTSLGAAMEICNYEPLHSMCVMVWDGKAIVHQN